MHYYFCFFDNIFLCLLTEFDSPPFSLGEQHLPCKLCQLFGVWQVDSRDASWRKLLPCHVLWIIWRWVFTRDLLFMVYVFLVIWIWESDSLKKVSIIKTVPEHVERIDHSHLKLHLNHISPLFPSVSFSSLLLIIYYKKEKKNSFCQKG